MIIKFHGHSTIELQVKNNIIFIDPYLDPFAAERLPKADVILVSHAGYDHCSVETIRKLSVDKTVVLGARDVAALLHNCARLTEGEIRDFGDFQVKALHAVPYSDRHVQGSLLAFGISAEGRTLLYPSDTKYLLTMAELHPDIMLVAVGGTLTMTAKEAANFVNILMPKIAIPIHYGKINGTIDDAVYFKELVEAKRETKVVILKEDESVEL